MNWILQEPEQDYKNQDKFQVVLTEINQDIKIPILAGGLQNLQIAPVLQVELLWI